MKKREIRHPIFSWEKPIEQAILEFVRYMASYMETTASRRDYGWFANNRLQEDAEKAATAYRTVEGQILKEIEIRK